MEKVDIDIMPVTITYADIENYLRDYCITRDIEDMSKAAQMKWTGALLYIYDHTFKPNENTIKYNNKIAYWIIKIYNSYQM